MSIVHQRSPPFYALGMCHQGLVSNSLGTFSIHSHMIMMIFSLYHSLGYHVVEFVISFFFLEIASEIVFQLGKWILISRFVAVENQFSGSRALRADKKWIICTVAIHPLLYYLVCFPLQSDRLIVIALAWPNLFHVDMKW